MPFDAHYVRYQAVKCPAAASRLAEWQSLAA